MYFKYLRFILDVAAADAFLLIVIIGFPTIFSDIVETDSLNFSLSESLNNSLCFQVMEMRCARQPIKNCCTSRVVILGNYIECCIAWCM